MNALESLTDARPSELEGDLHADPSDPAELFHAILQRPSTLRAMPSAAMAAILVGQLVGLRSDEPRALVVFPGVPGAAPVAARRLVDLHGAHIGQPVVLAFDDGDVSRPIVMGVLQDASTWPARSPLRELQIEADGERLVVGARRQLVLRCGRASITLEADGKVLILGTRIVSEAEGANCIRGGSVQLN